MKKRALLIVFLLSFSFSLIPFPMLVNAQEIIYIKSDGRIEGTDQIKRYGGVYAFIGDISGTIKVERNFTVIDGGGYTLQGTGKEIGIDLSTIVLVEPLIVGVTVKNLNIKNFSTGIHSLYNNTFVANSITDCVTGINIHDGANNLITNNTFRNNGYSISISYSRVHNITYNNFMDGTTILVWRAPTPNVSMNYWYDYNGTDADGDGIGDTPYVYLNTSYAKGSDNYPLVKLAAIPEFPQWIILPLTVAVTLMVIVFRKKS